MQQGNFGERIAHQRMTLVALTVLTVLIFFVSLSVGRYYVPLSDCIKTLFKGTANPDAATDKTVYNVIWSIRVPRAIAAIVVGAALSLSGITYQCIFHNPMVSPDLLGVSGGACTGAAIALLLALPSTGVELLALCGGILAVTLSSVIPRMLRDTSTLALVLSGVIVGGMMNSALGLCKYMADPGDELASIVYWTMGSFSYTKLSSVALALPAIATGAVVIIALRWRIGIISVSEVSATTLGINTRLLRGVCVVCATVMTACSVCLCGTIGWVGLMIPHLARLILGQDTRFTIPASAIMGAGFMVMIDTLARNITTAEMPLSILTGFIGAPLFFILLVQQRRRSAKR